MGTLLKRARRYYWECRARTWHLFLGYEYECDECGLRH